MPLEIQFTPLLVPYLVSAAVTLWLTWHGIQQYRSGTAATKTTIAFVGIVLSVSVWTIARSLELLFVSTTLSRFWLSMLYVGYGGATMSALFFGLAFTGRRHLLTRRNVSLLLIIPTLAVFVAATNQLHELFWTSQGFPEESGWWGAIVVHNRTFEPAFFGYFIYTVTATLVGIYYLLRTAVVSTSIYRRQTLALVIGSAAALTTGVMFALGRQPLVPDFVDLSPIGFALMGLCFGYAIFQHQLLDVVPVARDTVIEGMRDGYVVLDTDDRIVDLNNTAQTMFNVDTSVIGQPLVRALPECTDVVTSHDHGTPTETDIELNREGDRQFLSVSVSSLYEDETLIGRLLLLQDITDSQQLQRRYQALIENSSDLIIVVTPEEEMTYVSPSLQSIMGVDPEQLLGENAFTYVHEDDRDEFKRLFNRLLENPGEKFRYEYRAPDAEGNWLYLEASVWNLLDNPFVEGIVVNAREVTERKQRERALKQANEQLEQFASIVSHDLRSPLTVAHGHLELAQETDEPDHFERVEAALVRMDNIIEDMLELTRKGMAISETTPVNIELVAQQAWDHVETGDATLVNGDSATVLADRPRLLQLFENLFRNAVEHGVTEENTEELTVTVGHDGSLYIADNGEGIPPELRDDVLDVGYSTSSGGIGLGLSIVTRIADAHGWTVRVTESADGGTRIEFDGVSRVE